MNPTQTGMAVGIAGAAITLHAWALMGFPVHEIPDVPTQIEAIAAAMVTMEAWVLHHLVEIAQSFRAGQEPTTQQGEAA